LLVPQAQHRQAGVPCGLERRNRSIACRRRRIPDGSV
jgi:hypothetical protein